jgi:hypothetical protein
MLRRTLLGAATLGFVGLPYVMSTSSQPAANKSAATSGDYVALSPLASLAPHGPPDASGPAAEVPFLAGTPRPEAPLAGPPVANLEELFRFDITPDWVLARWPRVSTVTNQPELKGYRVPVVTGARPHDLAGSLTYYFNAKQEPQRIIFHGTTGDAEPLAKLMISKFKFRRVSDADAGTLRFQVQWSGKPLSELRVRPAQVVESGEPYRRFEVNLLIERPTQQRRGTTDGQRKLSEIRL